MYEVFGLRISSLEIVLVLVSFAAIIAYWALTTRVYRRADLGSERRPDMAAAREVFRKDQKRGAY